MPQPQLVNREYKEKFIALTDALGHSPTTLDREYWELTEWYKNQYDVDRIARLKEEAKERAAEKKYSGPVKVIEKVCATCENIIPLNRKGRAPNRCDDCRAKPKPKRVVKPKQPKAIEKRICRLCPNEIIPTGKRGRPAVLCDECKGKK